MINKYWDSKYSDLIERVNAWNALEGGFYDNKELRSYNNYKWHDLSESQIESQINKVEADLKKYFYCPKCGKKTQISSAVIKRKRINTRVNIDNAAMPGWMKLKATSEFSYIRFCPKCADSTDNIYIREYVKAYDGNAIVNNIESKITKRDSGCMSLITTIVSILCISVWFICLILS